MANENGPPQAVPTRYARGWFASAFFALSAMAVNPAASRTAMSASTFRSSGEPLSFRPAMSCE